MRQRVLHLKLSFYQIGHIVGQFVADDASGVGACVCTSHTELSPQRGSYVIAIHLAGPEGCVRHFGRAIPALREWVGGTPLAGWRGISLSLSRSLGAPMLSHDGHAVLYRACLALNVVCCQARVAGRFV